MLISASFLFWTSLKYSSALRPSCFLSKILSSDTRVIAVGSMPWEIILPQTSRHSSCLLDWQSAFMVAEKTWAFAVGARSRLEGDSRSDFDEVIS